MEADRDIRIAEAVEEIGRNAERVLKRRSPFHLQACGGCGSPAYQQPCNLCGFYPMGGDKGAWHPKVASLAQFEKMIERSGPGGKDGTIATWHARETMSHRPERCEEAAAAAAATSVPSAAEVWQAVTVEGRRFNREQAPRHVADGWEGLSELARVVGGEYGARSASPRLANEAGAALDKWVSAVHAADTDEMAAAVEAGLAACRSAMRTGNLIVAEHRLESAAADLRPQGMRP